MGMARMTMVKRVMDMKDKVARNMAMDTKHSCAWCSPRSWCDGILG